MKWRFIPFEYYDPYFKTALNEVSVDSVSKSKVPILWLCGWEKDCVNLGISQKISEVLNLEEIKKRDILILRRQGGGGTTFLSKNGEITWNIIAPKEIFPNDINEIYEFVCNKIVKVLDRLEIKSEHKIINDVITKNGKISGATLKKVNDVIYIAGTLLYDVDKDLMDLILKPENDSNKKSLSEKEKKITSIKNESNASFENVLTELKKELLSGYEYEISNWNLEEIDMANKLKEKYSSDEWIYGDEKNS
jgi:lipoate-protein ligase A